jgi:hypothetical protein
LFESFFSLLSGMNVELFSSGVSAIFMIALCIFSFNMIWLAMVL